MGNAWITMGKCKTKAIQVDLGILTLFRIQSYSEITQAYHEQVRSYLESRVTLAYSFRTLVCLEPVHIQNPRHFKNPVNHLRWSVLQK